MYVEGVGKGNLKRSRTAHLGDRVIDKGIKKRERGDKEGENDYEGDSDVLRKGENR